MKKQNNQTDRIKVEENLENYFSTIILVIIIKDNCDTEIRPKIQSFKKNFTKIKKHIVKNNGVGRNFLSNVQLHTTQ